MQGHLRKRGDRWAFVVELERDADRERHQKWVSGFATKAAAQKALREKLSVLDADGDPFPAALTVREYVVDQWLPHLRKQGKLAPRTIQNYGQLTRDHLLPVIGALELRAVRVADIQRVLDQATARGLSAGTVGNLRGALSAAFRQACRWELIVANPVRDSEAPKNAATELRVPTPDELRKIRQAVCGGRFEIAVLLSTTTGARRNEVLGLRWRNVDLDLGRVDDRRGALAGRRRGLVGRTQNRSVEARYPAPTVRRRSVARPYSGAGAATARVRHRPDG